MNLFSSPHSKRFVSLPFSALTFSAAIMCLLSATTAFAQNSASSQPSTPSPLITQPINELQRTVLKGNTHPLARPQFDLGTAPASLPMQRMLLVLKRSPEQDSALLKLLDDQQTKSSASYHNWLTPQQFGKQFGPSDADMRTITAWLQSHGFQVGSTKGRTVLEFSGTAGQVQEAFHTTIHKYVVNGEQHWANSSDPSIPTALTPAVAGVLTLHNFLKKPAIHFSKKAVPAKLIPEKKPQVSFPAQNGQPALNALAPEDYAVIYNINPLYNVDNDGNGTSIAVVGRSNLFNGGQDVQNFDNTVGSGNGFNSASLSIVLNGPDPGDLGGDEEAEATLDSTWSGAIAPGANVYLVVSATTNTADGIDLSEVYIVENNLAYIMTESFSGCELYATDAQLAGTRALAEQAAAQGISYFVSTGDNGAEGCDDPSTPPATHPISVNMLASTAFNVAVGGTMFNENGDTSKYWGTEPPVEESAISYIPEDVWNESSPTAGLWAGSGGASAGNIQNGGTTPGVPKPSWQSGPAGLNIPNDDVRDLPDVSLSAAGHDPYILCLEGSCVPNSQNDIYVYFASGTSASAPSFAGIMALVEQAAAPGGRQGQANYVLYPLAAAEVANLSECNASNTSVLPASTCVFNDVTVGNNSVPGETGYPDGLYSAGVGYDQASGLGSVNVANLAAQWNKAGLSSATTTLALSQTTGIIHGQSVNATITVAPTSGTGAVPTGDVSLIAFPAENSGLALAEFSLNNGTVSNASITDLPGGTSYGVIAYYGGSPIYSTSDSFPTMVTVSPESSTTAVSVLTAVTENSQVVFVPFTGGPFGSFVYLRADVAGSSGHGTPTGTVNFTDTFGTIPGGTASGLSLPLNSGDTFQNGANTATPNGILNFEPGKSPHTIYASYSGDNSFTASSSSPSQSFTITPGFYAAIASNATAVVAAPGDSGQALFSVVNSTGFSGTISLACSKLPTGAACSFSPSSVTASGTANTTPVTITVTTTAASAASLRAPDRHPLPRWLAMGSFAFFSILLIGAPRRRASGVLVALLALIFLMPACGGGSSTPAPPPPPPATSAGTYNIVVTATGGSITSTTGFTLVVQ